MAVKKLTKAESDWLAKFKSLMTECPSRRLGAYTTGDAQIAIYDKPAFDSYRIELEAKTRNMAIHDRIGSVLDTVVMPFQVDGVAG